MNPHHREYAGAILGMTETYGSPSQPVGCRCVAGRLVNVFAVGEVVTFDATDGSRHMGRIEEACNDDLYIIRSDDGHRRVAHADAIYPF
jgi:hypothetical protein